MSGVWDEYKKAFKNVPANLLTVTDRAQHASDIDSSGDSPYNATHTPIKERRKNVELQLKQLRSEDVTDETKTKLTNQIIDNENDRDPEMIRRKRMIEEIRRNRDSSI